jgi:transposase InsO family protein
VLDDFNREGLGIEVDFSLPAEREIRSLDRIIEWRGKPTTRRVDNGPEDISGKLMEWAEKQGVTIQHIQPGQPQQNAYIERYNRTVRYEWLANISSKASNLTAVASNHLPASGRLKISPHNGSGLTTTTARTWASAA